MEVIKITYFSQHCHLSYSNIRLIDSINKPEDILKRSAQIGLKGIAVTDHECLSGHVKFLKANKEMKEKGTLPSDFKIGLGNEIYLVHEETLEELKENYKAKNELTKFYHFLLIAKDLEGYQQLKELSSLAWENMYSTGFMERVPTFKSNLQRIIKGNHIVATTACLGGFVPQMILKMKQYEEDKAQQSKYRKLLSEFIQFCVDVFGKDDFYFEIQPSHQPEQIYVNERIIQLSHHYGIRYTIATDAHYEKPEDRYAHKVYLQSQEGEREVDDFYESAYVMSEEDIFQYMSPYLTEEQIQTGLDNTLILMDSLTEFDLVHRTVIPKVKLKDFELKHLFKPAYEQYEYIKNFAYSEHEMDRYLLYQCENGFTNLFPRNTLSREYFHKILDRINTEFGELWNISIKLDDRMSSYYVLTQEVVDMIWNEGDSIVGVSRGSALGYFINYLLGIVQANPLDYNLPHWRHLTAERPELPDWNTRSSIPEMVWLTSFKLLGHPKAS